MSVYDSTLPYPRDLVGYGATRRMPNGRAAPASPCSLCSITKRAAKTRCCMATPARAVSVRDVQPASYPARHLSMEGIYEYGSRAGVWRLLREFESAGCRSRCLASAWHWSATPS